MRKNCDIWMTVYLCSINVVLTSFARYSVNILDYFLKQTNTPIIIVIIKVFH